MTEIVTWGAVILVLVLSGMLAFSRLRGTTIAVVLLGIGFAYAMAVVSFSYALDSAFEKRHGPQHVFTMTGQTQFLEESVALERAQQALLLGGYTNGFWKPVGDNRSASPDGRPDLYLVRNSRNPKMGSLMFTNGQGAQLCLRVEIQGSNLLCQRIALK